VRWLGLLIAVVAVACWLGFGRAHDPELDAMLADPMAHAVVPGATLVNSSEHGAGTPMGKPMSAKVFRSYQPDPGVSVDQVLASALDVAKANGWDMRRESATNYIGSKAGMSAGLYIGTDTPRPGAPETVSFLFDTAP
jgi:hypothetical protein